MQRSTSKQKPSSGWRRMASWAPLLLSMCSVLLLAGCSASSGSFSLGLAGSTADEQVTPPPIASNGPGGTYAFVYANQVWVRKDGDTKATEVTHLVLSKGGTIAWGPLVWSPDGNYIAFALVQNLDPAQGGPASTAGPIYYVNLADSNHPVSITPGTGSIYGHTYTWYGSGSLLYADGGGIQLYDMGTADNQNADARVFQVLSQPDKGQALNRPTDYISYGDIAYTNGKLYYTQMDMRSLGRVGQIGSASLCDSRIESPAQADANGDEPRVSSYNVCGDSMSLGTLYTAPDHTTSAGAWAITGTKLLSQNITKINEQNGTTISQFCTQTLGYTLRDSCPNEVLHSADTQPWSIHPQVALSSNGTAALTGDGVYIDGASAKIAGAGWTTPPAWTPDGSAVAVTTLASTGTGASTSATGTPQKTSNIALYASGHASSVLIAGAQNIAWQP